ncbi:hypothetical protein [Actinomadura macrotermitis]|uniref:Guanylate cyclase domain-containing protein n=1 Tax=Actinomadura macrotermitis TaxID=2585200 RepID=A0A7K0C104_9ACTN|nr:hypothetical protein [Actinomadura macrotermitis]MQY07036.1 hypothetical protein [Actinomadura macrotermitis]
MTIELREPGGRLDVPPSGPVPLPEAPRLPGAPRRRPFWPLLVLAGTLTAAGVLLGLAGAFVLTVLFVIAMPVVVFTLNQMRLTSRGCELATSVTQVQALKESDAAAFARPLVLLRQQQQRPAAEPWTGRNCSILYTDIAAFGARARDDRDREELRAAMYEVIRTACRESGLDWAACYHEDRGDGALVVVPPGIPTRAVVDPFLARLAAGLARHNRRAGTGTRMQLRAALDVGPVLRDAEGVSGESIIQTARLLEAPVLKERLAETGADLGFIASAFVYDTVLRHRPGDLDPGDFQSVQVAVKEARLTGWMRLS